MDKKDFEILMNSLYSNNQLFIPQGQNIKEWIDNAFVEKQEEAINYTRCCTELPTKKDIIFDDSLMAEIETTDKNLKVLRAVNGWGKAINIANVQINDK